jgi:hypothetical protein
MTLNVIDPALQMRCVLCGALFVAIDDEHEVRLSRIDALKLRMRAGDHVCHSCWINEIAVDRFGNPTIFTGHA